MSGIVWLASYPKSGNTWFRAFLTNLQSKGEGPADINELNHTIFSSRFVFDSALGWESSDLPADAINRLRPRVQEILAEGENVFFKAHEAFVHPVTREPLFSLKATRAAVYIIRNPLDVAVSFSAHIGKDIDTAITRMNARSTHLATGGGALHMQLSQPLGDWSGHVRSWVDAPGLIVHTVRYEDMMDLPHEAFSGACRFLGLPDDPVRVARALEHSSFKEMQLQEKAKGFREVSLSESQFFRRGRAGSWREVLSPAQVAEIVDSHGEIMRRFGYLRPDGSCT